MRRPTVIPAIGLAAVAALAAGCQIDRADPGRSSATVSETLPPDAGDLENPSEVTSPGGGSGETEEDEPTE